ncbi:MAG: hypothetical protein ACO3UU_17005 [Minisyncoccia bacterium]
MQVPPSIIGVNKIFRFDGSNTITNNMFSVKYQLFLNDIYYWGSVELLSYAMVKTYLEDLDFLLNTQKQIRFNKRQDRLYLDIDWSSVTPDDYIIIECFRILDPRVYPEIYNDRLLKKYTTALIKKQWGENLSKFEGITMPGGVTFNGKRMIDEAQVELDKIEEQIINEFELPPSFIVG